MSPFPYISRQSAENKDRIVNLLSQHRATKNKRDLQELMLNPLPKLTKAFVESLKSRIKPVILVFDTYEKGLLDIDAWLWQYLLVDNDLQSLPIRLIVAGRDNILEKESWRKLQQDKNLVREEKLECFDENQTKEYLERIDNKKYEETETIFQITKGLPYYLNWIRKQTKELDFSQANREIVNLLLQGLNENQIIFVKIAACCHFNLAVENLEKAISLDEEYRDMAKNDADFDRIREDSRFQKLI
jgi:hypothetical protein